MTGGEAPGRRILCIGECMAELAPLAEAETFRLGFAGDTFNTAWYLRHLRDDLAVSYLSAVGRDDISDRMLAFMAGAGIDTAHVRRLEGRSVGLYLISLTNGERAFSYWRDTSAAKSLADDPAALEAAMETAGVIYFSGITLAILPEEGRARLLSALGRARGQGRTIAFDPNLRPRLWPSNAAMTRAIMEGAAVADLVLPSFEDEAGHFRDADPEATATRYVEAGADSVIVKNGPDPVHFASGGRRGVVTIPAAEEVVDTTSAGDSFNAGFLSTMDSGAGIEARIAFAAGVAVQVIGGRGALVPITPPRISA